VQSALQPRHGAPIAFDATLRAAAPYQLMRQVSALGGHDGGEELVSANAGSSPPTSPAHLAVRLAPYDLRFQRRHAPLGRLLLFVVDASGSMAGQRRIAMAKGAIEALLLDAYRRRDRVAMIAFRGMRAEVVLPPTNSVDLARRRSRDLPAGGTTPLAAALDLTHYVVTRYAGQGSNIAPVVVVLSDGRANVAADGADPWESALRAAARLRRLDLTAAVVDAGGAFDLGFTVALARSLGAPCFHLPLPPVGLPPTAIDAPVRWS
jgi:magnesium chelatase subunit D